MTLGSGESWGRLNGGQTNMHPYMETTEDERIIGFYGQSDQDNGFTHEFGIITAPKNVVDSEEGLPRQVYGMSELMNTDGGLVSTAQSL